MVFFTFYALRFTFLRGQKLKYHLLKDIQKQNFLLLQLRYTEFRPGFWIFGDLYILNQLAGFLIQSNQSGIQGCHVDFSVCYRSSSISRATAKFLGSKLVFITPELLAGPGIQGHHMV